MEDLSARGILHEEVEYGPLYRRSRKIDTFFSFGLQLVMPDEARKIEGLTIATVLNGEVRRENVVANMTFSPWFLVSFYSKVMTLLPSNCTN